MDINALGKQQLVQCSVLTNPQLKLSNSFWDERLKMLKIKLKSNCTIKWICKKGEQIIFF